MQAIEPVVRALGTSWGRISVAALGALVLGSGAAGQYSNDPWTISAPSPEGGAAFGDSAALDGDTLVIGATFADSVVADAGAAFVYRWSGAAGWTHEATLSAFDGAAFDRFGAAVAIEGETIVVGAYENGALGPSAGAAYVFTRAGDVWTLATKLTASDGAAQARFGTSVGVSGDSIVVGASQATGPGGPAQGAAYMFERQDGVWSETGALLASDGASSDQFGDSVSISGGSVVIGAPSASTAPGSGQGAAYVFEKGGVGWNEAARLSEPGGGTTDLFGVSVAIDGDWIAIGASLADGAAGLDQGKIVTYERAAGSWWERATLTPQGAVAGQEFGRAVAIDGATVVGGAPALAGGGGAYVFVRDGFVWTEQAKLSVSGSGVNDQYGASVAVAGDFALLCGTGADLGAIDAGAAALAHRDGTQWSAPMVTFAAHDASTNARFGHDVALRGDWMAIGASLDANQGSVYMYKRIDHAWVFHQKLDSALEDVFHYGQTVTFNGDLLAVGSPLDNGIAGSIFLFEFNGVDWVEIDRLFPPPGSFGEMSWDVAFEGDMLIAGAPTDTISALSWAGTAFVFREDGGVWTRTQELRPPQTIEGELFGSDVVMDGNTLLIGAPGLDGIGPPHNGAVYVYIRSGDTWIWAQTLTASDGASEDSFGSGLAIEGDLVVIGAPGASGPGGAGQGALYFFSRDGGVWTETLKVTTNDGGANASFGARIELDGDRLVAGASGATGGVGAVYVFDRLGDTWMQRARIHAEDPASGDRFGLGLDMQDGLVLASRYFADDPGLGLSNSGSVSIFGLDGMRMTAGAYNESFQFLSPNVGEAVSGALGGETIVAIGTSFYPPMLLDFEGKDVHVTAIEDAASPWMNAITLADGASLRALQGDSIVVYGDMLLPSGATASLGGRAFSVGASGSLMVEAGATLRLESLRNTLRGATRLLGGASIISTRPVAVAGEFLFPGGSVTASDLTIDHGGRAIGSGDIVANLRNRDGLTTTGDTIVYGDFVNEASGRVTVQVGTLTLLGSLVNDGVIAGDVQTPLRGVGTAPGDGFAVGRDYRAGADASLLLASDLWRMTVGGDVDVAITDSGRFDLSNAELRIGGLYPSDLETMSTDIGASSSGLNGALPGHYPIGTLRLIGNVTTLVDNHNNDNLGQTPCEAIYVRDLVIESGASLITGDCVIYYETLSNNGAVDDPTNLRQISLCAADFDGDSVVDGMDLSFILARWSTADPVTDLNADGAVDGMDLAALLAAWGACD